MGGWVSSGVRQVIVMHESATTSKKMRYSEAGRQAVGGEWMEED